LGAHINAILDWSYHCHITAAKATKCLKFVCHLLLGCHAVKSGAYKCISWPILEYATLVWNPHAAKALMYLNQSNDELHTGLQAAMGFFFSEVVYECLSSLPL